MNDHTDHDSPVDSSDSNHQDNCEVTTEAIPLITLRGRQLCQGIEKQIEDNAINQRKDDRRKNPWPLSVKGSFMAIRRLHGDKRALVDIMNCYRYKDRF